MIFARQAQDKHRNVEKRGVFRRARGEKLTAQEAQEEKQEIAAEEEEEKERQQLQELAQHTVAFLACTQVVVLEPHDSSSYTQNHIKIKF